MERKINRMGGYSYIVVIPPEWIRDMKIKESVNVDVKGDMLVITKIK